MLEAGVLDWDEKFELIRGEIVPMASEKARHAQMKARLARWLMPVIPAGLDVGCDITVSLARFQSTSSREALRPSAQNQEFRPLSDEKPGSTFSESGLGSIGIFEPDILVWRPVSGDGFIPISAAVLAIEVADTTLRSDLRLKAPDYAAAGLPELWVVDLNGAETIRFTEPADGQWGKEERFAFDAPIGCGLAPQAEVRLASLA